MQISRSIRSTCKLTSTGGLAGNQRAWDWNPGRECTYPSGQTYLVSDEGNACSTLACVLSGKYTGCVAPQQSDFGLTAVHCAQMETLAYESSSEPVLIAPPLSALPIASPPPVLASRCATVSRSLHHRYHRYRWLTSDSARTSACQKRPMPLMAPLLASSVMPSSPGSFSAQALSLVACLLFSAVQALPWLPSMFL